MVKCRYMKAAGMLLVAVLLSAGAAPPESPVADAAMRGDIEAVVTLLKEGADVNAAQGDGMTALHWAAKNGSVELAQILISAGANVDAVTRVGAYTSLHLASRAGHAEVAGALLEAGSNPNAATTTGGATSLHFAAASGVGDVVAVLLDHGAAVNAREASWGQTPLMWAAAYARIEVLRLLLERGADVALTTKVVDIPARQAADEAGEDRRDEVLAAFRAKEATEEGEAWRPDPNQVQAAVLAARQVQMSWSKTGGEPETEQTDEPEALSYEELVGAQGGLTALLHATREGHAKSVLALVDAGADINQVSAGDHTSPLLMAVINGHFDLALRLLERGADPNVASDAGAAPLFAAINVQWAPKARYPQPTAYKQQRATYLDVMKALLDSGADPNLRLKKHVWYMSYTFDLLDVNTRGATPFWRAAYATDVEAMKLLVAHGADPHVPTVKPPERRRDSDEEEEEEEADPSGLAPIPVGGPAVWPIHAASGVGYGEGYAGNAHRHVPDGWLPAMTYLVEELGADVNARDHNGYNAVHHAAARGDTELILYLVEKGADVTAVSREGQTTADMANGPVQRISPFPNAVQLLESLGSKNNHNCVSC